MTNLKILPERGAGFSTEKFMKKVSPGLPAHLRNSSDKKAMANTMKGGLEKKIKYGYLTDDNIREAMRKFKGENKGVTDADVKSYKERLQGYTRAAERAGRQKATPPQKKGKDKVVPFSSRAPIDDPGLGYKAKPFGIAGQGKISTQDMSKGMIFSAKPGNSTSAVKSKGSASVVKSRPSASGNLRPIF
ncbi:MAG: hypothetical protein WC715_01105 [Patescibacteria group bacterium]